MRQYDVKIDSCFDAHLGPEALEAHVKELAALPLRGVTRIPGLTRATGELSRIFMRVAAYARAGDELLSACTWLLENYPYLEEAMQATAGEIRRLPAMPALVGDGPRAYQLVCEAVSHSDGLVDGELLALCARSYLSLRPLRISELWALPRLASVALLAALVQVADQSEQAQSDRRRGDHLADELIAGQDVRLSEQELRNPTIIERISARLREEEGARLQELDLRLQRTGADRVRIVDGEHRRQAVRQLRIANIIHSLRGLESLDWAEYFEALSPVEALLRSERSGVYAKMDFDSRDVLRHQVERFARGHKAGEEQVARTARALADAATGRESHVGYYLYGEGKRMLSRRLEKANGSMSLWLWICDHARGIYMALVMLLTAAIAVGIGAWQGIILGFLAVFPARSAAIRWIGRLMRAVFPPRVLLKLDYESGIPHESATLVVVPTLLTSKEQAYDQCRHLEEMYLANRDDNLRFMMLTDFADHDEESRIGDGDILRAAKEGIEELRSRLGNRFGVMHRPRIWHEGQRRFMGRERKRGALEDLNHYLLRRDESRFCLTLPPDGVENCKFVLTVDSDTVIPPGAAAKLVGAMAHPMNRKDASGAGYGVLAPCMESLPDRTMTLFQKIYSGLVGTDAYASASSEVYQDIAGEGIFCGKGIYDLAAFDGALRDKIPDNAVLSHDLLEGLFAGAALCSDVVFFDGQPRNLISWGKRLHRWTRGDWQLLPFLFHRDFKLMDRFKIVDNMRRSLTPAAVLLCLFFGQWPLAPLVLFLMMGLPLHPMDYLCRLCFLPFEALMQLDAIGRALWRTFVSRKRMLDWVTAADAEKKGQKPLWQELLVLPVCGLLMLLSESVWLSVFWVGGVWLAYWLLQPAYPAEEMSQKDRSFLLDIARRTYHWFDINSDEDDNFLPPDNVQYEPYKGRARRTSPTNIGLGLTADVAAWDLDFIDTEQMLLRLGRRMDSIEKLPLWQGHPYNWYSTQTLEPMQPFYVSAVDNGNFAACLWAAAAAAREAGDEALARRFDAFVERMDFSLLYDAPRRLFYIGFDVNGNCPGKSHYDLLASESRLLSFVAIAKGDVPARHFGALSRPLTRACGKPTLLSWSGTMFEYLMPRLFLRDQPGTLLDTAMKGAVCAQQKAAQDRPWGESESGYYAFDLALNYQYRAFGIAELAMRGGLPGERVVAPYAVLLALLVDPVGACKNLRRMVEMGFLSEHGFYEAVDFTPERVPVGDEFAVVRSCMSHHHGMGLLALEGALGGKTQARFSNLARIAAHEVLLCERVPRRYAPVRVRPVRKMDETLQNQPIAPRTAHPGELHLLSGGGTLLAVDVQNAGYVQHQGLALTRFRAGQRDLWGPQIYLRDVEDNRITRISDQGLFFEGKACFSGIAGVHGELEMAVSPEDGTLVQQVHLTNRTDKKREIQVTGYIEPVLTTEAADSAHRAFNDLFLEVRPLSRGVIVRRRPRAREEHPRMLTYLCDGDGVYDGCETSRMAFIGRRGNLSVPAGLYKEIPADKEGFHAPIEPCAALRRTVVLEPGQSAYMTFAMAYTGEEEKESLSGEAEYAFRLAAMRAQVERTYLKLGAKRIRLYERGAYLLTFPHSGREATRQATWRNRLSQSDLWRFGISGDVPIALVRVKTVAQCALAKEIISAHEFWRMKGLVCDLVLLNDHGNDYLQPVRDRLEEMIRSASHLHGLNGVQGGVHILAGEQLNTAEQDLLMSRAAIYLDGEMGRMEKQLPVVQEKRHSTPAHAKSQLPTIAPLRLTNEYGGFTDDGKEYVITKRPPAPWVNIIANPSFGTMVTDSMGGYTWAENSRENKLTPWCNDPVSEPHGEGIRLQDLQSGQLCAMDSRCRHGQGYSVFEGSIRGVLATATVFVDRELPVKCTDVTLTNTAQEERRLSLEAYALWVLAPAREDSLLSLFGHAQDGLCWVRNGYGVPGLAFLQMQHAQGEGGADALLRREIILSPGEKISVSILLGWCEDLEQAQNLCQKFTPQESLANVKDFWDEFLGRITVKTPDTGLNMLLNRWFPYQALACRYWGRTAFYQSGGAYGFRDQLQDACMLAYYDPQILREQILRCAAHQFEEGDVQHWWHEPRRGVRTRIRDDLLFLPWAVAEYVRLSGRRDILDEVVPFLCDMPLQDGQEDRYGSPQTGKEATIMAHCIAAIEQGCQYGAHGLPLMGGGDWNDAMNRVGIKGRGESVWLGWFLCDVLDKFSALCDEPTAQSLRNERTKILGAIEEHGWDGKWYRRAFFDDGSPMGTQGAGSCEIDLIAQAWGAMTAAPRDRATQAFGEAINRLFDRQNGVVRLLTPPFDGQGEDAGYIAGYVSGVRENGGQYTHGASWSVLAACALNQADLAWELLRAMLPVYKDPNTYRVEPYVAVADVYSGEHAGRGGWSWYTGSAPWLWRAAVEGLCGLRVEAGEVMLEPCLPKGWEGTTELKGSALKKPAKGDDLLWKPQPGVGVTDHTGA